MKTACRIVVAASVLLWHGYLGAQAVDDVEVMMPAGVSAIFAHSIEKGKLLITAQDASGNPVRGLTDADFAIMKGLRRAEIVSVETLEQNQDISLNLVLVVDNSSSMKHREAVEPLLTAMEAVLKTVRPIDQVHLVVFDDRQTLRVKNHDVRVRTIRSNNQDELRAFLQDAFYNRLTARTVLYDAMLAGVDIIKQMPEDALKFMVVFSDGEDINSTVKPDMVRDASKGIKNVEAFSVDYMPGPGEDPFLKNFAAQNGGRLWKAGSATDLVPIFQAVSSKLLYRYVVSYRFAPTGRLSVDPKTISVEEITTIESSPMLGHVYFETGSSEIPQRYVRLAGRTETSLFSEEQLRGSLEKHHNLLNVVGRRLIDNPEASIDLVGCNSNTGTERGNTTLSRLRAESVKAYLEYVWGISPDRMVVTTRNLPPTPSTNRIQEGRDENQRVEIVSPFPEIVDVIRSAYVEAKIDTKMLTVNSVLDSVHPISRWNVTADAGGQLLGSLEGRGKPAEKIVFPVDAADAERLAAAGAVTVTLSLEDQERQQLKLSADPVAVRFIQKRELMARNLGYKVLEKYALILFDFDSDRIKDRNKAIVERIVARIRSLPNATVEIVGHTDTIGKEDYNMKLSERRAKAVYDQLTTAYGPAPTDRIRFSGMGPFNPLYENTMPEGRALNRTVTIALEYETGN